MVQLVQTNNEYLLLGLVHQVLYWQVGVSSALDYQFGHGGVKSDRAIGHIFGLYY